MYQQRCRIGILLACALAGVGALGAPACASAAVSTRYVLTEGNARLLAITGGESDDQIVLSCSNGSVVVNGQQPVTALLTDETDFPVSKEAHIPCGGAGAPQVIEIFGEGGDDTINTAAVSRQQFTSLLPVKEGFYSLILIGGMGRNTLIGGPVEEEFNSIDSPADPSGDVISAGGGNDQIWGTEGPDVISGGPGEDAIEALGGADVVHAGPGNDHIVEEPFFHGNERLYGEGGNDEIFGGAGNDLIEGGPGNDYLVGHGGNDRIIGGPGNDALYGEGGNDTLIGGPGHDTLIGGPGHNRLVQ